MKKWKYKIIRAEAKLTDFQVTLNGLGKEGWELVNYYIDYLNRYEAVFKREIEEN